MNAIDPIFVPPPCCAPTKLAPLDLLYVDDNGDVVMKTFNNMVVEQCGCQ